MNNQLGRARVFALLLAFAPCVVHAAGATSGEEAVRAVLRQWLDARRGTTRWQPVASHTTPIKVKP